MPKAKYEVEIPICEPADNWATTTTFRFHLWYAARRHGLHLDGDLTDNYHTPENVDPALQRFAPGLYLAPEDFAVMRRCGSSATARAR